VAGVTIPELDSFVDAHLLHEASRRDRRGARGDDRERDLRPANVAGGPLVGLDEVRRGYTTWATVAQCERFTSARRLYGDDFVADEGIWQGRFTAPLFGPARPDRAIRYRVLHLLELRGRRIERETVWHDFASIRRQLTSDEEDEAR